MEKMEALSKALSRAVALIGFFGLFVLAVMTSLDVVLRWLFRNQFKGSMTSAQLSWPSS